MNVLINISIFLIVLFLYIHIIHQLKTSEDLEIYEMDYLNNKNLQEICDIKQPVLFEYNSVYPEFFEQMTVENVSKYKTNELKIKDNNDYWKSGESVDYVVLPFQSSHPLMLNDSKAKYFTENNQDFIEDSGLNKYYNENDSFLKPDFTLTTKYDLITGSANTVTPLRYHTNFRHFLCVTSGKITVKMTPWKSRKYIDCIKDYENYEYRSQMNVWNLQNQYKNTIEKIKFLEFDVRPGFVLYIPSYWWYSIKFSNSTENLICGFTYNSIMNCISNIPNYGLYYLQQSNIKKKVTKILKNDENDKKDDEGSQPVTNESVIETTI